MAINTREAAENKSQWSSNLVQSVPDCLMSRTKSLRVTENRLVNWQVRGVQRSMTDDFAHICLEMHWSRLLPFVVGIYTVCSLFFGSLLYVTDHGDSIGGDVPLDMHAFEVCWWFSTVNLVTAGFGGMVPMGRYAYMISTAAHLIGLLLNSLLLGIVVAKASLPTAKMVFSNAICVRTRNSVQHLMIRVGNARGNILYSPDIRLAYVRRVCTEEGEEFFQDTQLQVKVPVSLQPIFMISHAVTPDSPLFGKTVDDVNKEKGFFVIIVSALYSKKLFFMKDFRFNHQFVDVVTLAHRGMSDSEPNSEAVDRGILHKRTIHFLKFHDTKALDENPLRHKREDQTKKLAHRFGNQKRVTDSGLEEEKPVIAEPEASPKATQSFSSNLAQVKPGREVPSTTSERLLIDSAKSRQRSESESDRNGQFQLRALPEQISGFRQQNLKTDIGESQPSTDIQQTKGKGMDIGVREAQSPRQSVFQRNPPSSMPSGTNPIGQYTGQAPTTGVPRLSFTAANVASIPEEAVPGSAFALFRSHSDSLLGQGLQIASQHETMLPRVSFDVLNGKRYATGDSTYLTPQQRVKEPSFDFWSPGGKH